MFRSNNMFCMLLLSDAKEKGIPDFNQSKSEMTLKNIH